MKTKLQSPQRGQTLVEFAIVLPLFLLISVLIFDFGRVVYYYSAIQNAARAGARYGAANPLNSGGYIDADVTGMVDAATKYAIGLGVDDLHVTYADLDPAYYETIGTFANPAVRVRVEYDVTPATPLLANFLPCGCGHFQLHSESIMRTEWIPYP